MIVHRIPSSPPTKMRERFGNREGNERNAPQGSPPAGGFGGPPGGGGMPMTPPKGLSMLWFFNKDEEIESVPVKTGSTDGKNIEITPLYGAKIDTGKQIIKSIESTEPTGIQNMRRPRGFGRPF